MYVGGYSMPRESVDVSERRVRECVNIRCWVVCFARVLRRSAQQETENDTLGKSPGGFRCLRGAVGPKFDF